MDPTASSLFPNDKVEWFLSSGSDPIGPMRAQDLYEKLSKAEVTYLQYAWREGMAEWQRICDIPTFQVAAPKAPVSPPSPPPVKKAVTPPPPIVERNWFLYFNETQMGPYSIEEASSVVRLQNLGPEEVLAWKDGMAGWETLGQVSAFAGRVPAPVSSWSAPELAAAAPAEKRSALRKPLIAKVLITDGEQVITGLCRDISIGGMQVQANYVPKKVGAALRMNVSPTPASAPQFLPFVAEGVVVRVFQDGRGFSFRFSEIPSQTKLVLDQIVQSS